MKSREGLAGGSPYGATFSLSVDSLTSHADSGLDGIKIMNDPGDGGADPPRGDGLKGLTSFGVGVSAALAIVLSTGFCALAQSSAQTDPRGPAATWDGKVLVNEIGVQAMRTTPDAALKMDGLRSPRWAWAPGDASAGADFRAERVVLTGSKVKRAPVQVSADGRAACVGKGAQDVPLALAACAHSVTAHQ